MQLPDNRDHRHKLYELFKEPVFRPNVCWLVVCHVLQYSHVWLAMV
jgi:hypothetical protein